MSEIVGALLITYFLSRAFRRFGLTEPSIVKLAAAHVGSLGVCVLGIFALRYPLFIFHKNQLLVYFLAQPVWVLYDLYRGRVAFWKAPPAELMGSSSSSGSSSSTGSSSRGPAAGAR